MQQQPIFSSAVVSLEWPYPGADRLPDVTSDSRWTGRSGVGLLDGGTVWQWLGADGGALAGTQTDPGTARRINSFIWGVQAIDVQAANQAPDIVSTDYNAIYGQVASTSFAVGYGRVTGSANNVTWLTGAYPGGSNGFFDMVDDRTGATEGSAGYWGMLSAPGVQSTQAATDGWAMMGARYDGVNSCGNNTHGTIDTGDINTQSCANLRRAFLAGTHFFEGADRVALTNFWNGPIVTIARGNTRLGDWDYGILVDKAWGSYNRDQRVTLKQSSTVQGEAIDNAPITGNVDVMWTKAPLITTAGLRTVKGHANNWCSDPLDFSTCTPVGGTAINKNVIAGPFAAMKGGTAECDEIVDSDAGAFMGYIGSEQISTPVPVPDDGGTRDTHYKTADYFLRKGLDDGGAGLTFDQATVIWTTNGTQDIQSCAFTGLTTTPTRYRCSVKLENPSDGGALSSAIPRLLVGTDAGQVGSIVACHGQTGNGPYSLPPWTTTRTQPDTYYDLPPLNGLQDGGSWPTQLDGGGTELVYVPLFQGNAPSVQPNIGDPEYLLDVHNVAHQDHTFVVVAGYPPTDGGTAACSLLTGFRSGTGTNTDLIIPNQCETVGHAYAVRGEWVNLGNGHCNVYTRRDDCGVPPALTANDSATVAAWRTALHAFTTGCVARTLIASDTSGTAVCPGSGALPDHAYLCNRLTANVPGDCQFLAVRGF